MSRRISSHTRSCAAVSAQGKAARSRETRSPGGLIATPRARVVRARRIESPSWSSRKSSNARRRRAAASASSPSGKWASRSAGASPTSRCRARTASGSGSATPAANWSTSRRSSPRSHRWWSPSVDE
ncbi:MAG: hypothetical protein HYV94_17595 [Candidatus Rokubacteria bacterium]|nr:hypothetical protein [Candidatus Rokubacteria bacterium]